MRTGSKSPGDARTTANKPLFTGKCFGGPSDGKEFSFPHSRVRAMVNGKKIGTYMFRDGAWHWKGKRQPNIRYQDPATNPLGETNPLKSRGGEKKTHARNDSKWLRAQEKRARKAQKRRAQFVEPGSNISHGNVPNPAITQEARQ